MLIINCRKKAAHSIKMIFYQESWCHWDLTEHCHHKILNTVFVKVRTAVAVSFFDRTVGLDRKVG